MLSPNETQEKLEHSWQDASIHHNTLNTPVLYCTHYAQHRLSANDFQYSRGTVGPCVEEYEKATVIAYTLKV